MSVERGVENQLRDSPGARMIHLDMLCITNLAGCFDALPAAAFNRSAVFPSGLDRALSASVAGVVCMGEPV